MLRLWMLVMGRLKRTIRTRDVGSPLQIGEIQAVSREACFAALERAEYAGMQVETKPVPSMEDLRSVLSGDNVYRMAASEAFPFYNKTHLISLQFPARSADIVNVPEKGARKHPRDENI
ncbi:hypothetical protein L2E82_31225 [Cichorium intybus]|uniref:Uncharacterized protein n=1 Tax=Cichorium intybus TaxID=13427 RepID=A0ACB9D2C6_CICIN|nr:hypothetical protein L2E82_31225 [Cichorium intybus]